jgi:hypothetical protein
MRILPATLLLIAAVPVYGSMIVVTGVTNVPAPPSVLLGQLSSDTTIYGFSEQSGVMLSGLTVGITTPGTWVCCSGLPVGIIPDGTTVNSYLLRASPSSSGVFDYQGEITFSPGESIVGIIIGYQGIARTDSFLGAPGTVYPPSSFDLGGLEPGDRVIWGVNNTVSVNFHVTSNGMDMIRILTTSPEPVEFALIGSGLIALALFRRRLGFRRTRP